MKFISKILSAYIIALSLACCIPIAQAQTNDVGSSLPEISNPLDAPNLSVSIPGLTSFGKTTCTDTDCINPWLSNYINALYRYGTGVIVILAVIVMMIAGVIWITAGGKEERVADAKQWIAGSLMGLLIAFSSYIILNIINPALTVLSPVQLSYVAKIDVPEIDLSKSAEENGITQTQLNTLRGDNPFQEGCGNIEKCKQFGSTMPPGLVKVDSKYGNVYLKAEVYEAFKKAQNCVNPNQVMFTFTDGWRSAAAQIDVKRRKPDLAATPCCSNHGSGSAMDLAKGKGGQMSWEYNDSSGLKRCMNQNNLFANLKSGKKNEPWHWSPTGK